MLESYVTIFVYAAFILANGVIMLALSHFLGPRRTTKGKFEPYECGVPILDNSRKRFSVKFYLIATLFILFDIETVFLIPWSIVYKDSTVLADPMMVFFYVLVFVAILTFGFVYIWRRGALEWD